VRKDKKINLVYNLIEGYPQLLIATAAVFPLLLSHPLERNDQPLHALLSRSSFYFNLQRVDSQNLSPCSRRGYKQQIDHFTRKSKNLNNFSKPKQSIQIMDLGVKAR